MSYKLFLPLCSLSKNKMCVPGRLEYDSYVVLVYIGLVKGTPLAADLAIYTEVVCTDFVKVCGEAVFLTSKFFLNRTSSTSDRTNK